MDNSTKISVTGLRTGITVHRLRYTDYGIQITYYSYRIWITDVDYGTEITIQGLLDTDYRI